MHADARWLCNQLAFREHVDIRRASCGVGHQQMHDAVVHAFGHSKCKVACPLRDHCNSWLWSLVTTLAHGKLFAG